ncbi:MAG: homogentisate 1,2-dioxygenase [Pseudomonadota bacterium]
MSTQERIIRGGRITSKNDEIRYQTGFRNTHSSEAEEGALPIGRNSPQRPPMGLYAEQLSGTAFTAPRGDNLRSWLYRIRPSVKHVTGLKPLNHEYWRTAPCRDEHDLIATQLRWAPIDVPSAPTDFIDGIRTITTCGDAFTQSGVAAHIYVANTSMDQRYFVNGDGELLIVPQEGALRFVTEMGVLEASPGEIIVVPRGVKFRVDLIGKKARGYICENYGVAFHLPERGPIGSNSLAEERDFLYPVAAYEDIESPRRLTVKMQGRFFDGAIDHSPLDVIAWHGRYAPYKYDLTRFNVIGSISFDHPDPSIFTVLTSPSEIPGTANADFVIFPDRWLVMEDTFRPPLFHTNVMSEFMGLIYGAYDAKPGGFLPGAASLHNAPLPHGPDAEAFDAATNAALTPQKQTDTLAFMFETRFVQIPTTFAAQEAPLDRDYAHCWTPLTRHFQPS